MACRAVSIARRRWRQLSAMAIRRPPSMSRIPLGKPRPSPRHSAAPLGSSMRQTVPLLRRSSRSRCHSSGACRAEPWQSVEDVGPGEAERRGADERLAAQHRQGFPVMGATDDGDAAAPEADREPPSLALAKAETPSSKRRMRSGRASPSLTSVMTRISLPLLNSR